MTKQETFRSFQDLDTSRFREDTDGGAPGKHEKAPAKHAVAQRRADNPGIEDETALFLAAVAGNVDVSMKHSPNVPAARPAQSRAEKPDAVPTAAESLPEPVRPPAPNPAGPEEAGLFANAMDGVRPIRARGRDLAPPIKPLALVRDTALMDMDALFSGKFEFSLEHTDEFVQGYVQGLDPVVLGKLKAGAYSPEAHVDLHGQNMEQAYATLAAFIKDAYQSGKRHLIVVTGRGKNSPGGTPVLRERVQSWFTRDPFKRVILGFCSAKPGDGGAGALYLLLRKRKKSQGKIVWDNKPTEEELLL